MKFKDLLDLCKKFSHSQGSYGRLYLQLKDAAPEQIAAIDEAMKDLHDELDIIMWIEG